MSLPTELDDPELKIFPWQAGCQLWAAPEATEGLCWFLCVGDPDVEVVSRYLQRMKRVYPAVEGRIKFSSGSLLEASLALISVLFTLTILHT